MAKIQATQARRNMKQPAKWKETVDPFSIEFSNFTLQQVLGYPHARNDVFYCKGLWQGQETLCFVKYASTMDSNVLREVKALSTLPFDFLPQVLDCDKQGTFVVTREVVGERLSYVLKEDKGQKSINYMFEYGKTLATIHSAKVDFEKVEHRKFFDVPSFEHLKQFGLDFAHTYLQNCKPHTTNACFCHGDFHYANVLWNDGKISAVLDWELCGIGNREFDVAWAIIHRPGQEFLNTQQEVDEFLRGYKSVCPVNEQYVTYYMALVYSHFVKVGKNNANYQQYVCNWMAQHAKI